MEKQIIPTKQEMSINGVRDLLKFMKANILFLVIITFSCFLVYANLIKGKFINLDDMAGFVQNPNIGNISATIKGFDGYSTYKALVFKLFGMSSTAYHVSAIVLHVINSILVFLLIYVIFGKKIAIIVTFMFITHPTNVEGVGWLSGFPYILRSPIILSVLLFFSIYKKSNNIKCFFISSLIFFFGVLYFRGSGWIFITPFLVVLTDQFIFEKKIEWKNIKIYLPFILVSAIFAGMVIPSLFSQRVKELQTLYYVNLETSTPLVNRIPYTIYMAYRLLVFPLELSIYHEGKVLSSAMYTFMVVVAIAIIFAIFYLWKKDRVISGLMMMILFSILPSFSPIIIAWTAAERYLYLGSVFSSTIIALLITKVENKYKIKNFTIIAAATIITLYSIRSVFRTNDFKDSKHLWFATRKTAPYSYRVYNNLGDVYADEKNYELALENFKRSLALKPDYADAVHNIGFIYYEMGDIERSKKYLTQALNMNPNLYQSSFKLGEIYYREGNYSLARDYFLKCLEANPENQDCKSYLNSIVPVTGQ